VGDREDWTVAGERYLADLVRHDVPTFGICYRHQMLAQALGGHVGPNPKGREIGSVPFSIDVADPLFDAAPADGFLVNATHLDSALTLPATARVLGRTELEAHAAVRFGPRAWGVQFHPEIDGEIIRYYVEARFDAIRGEGLGPEELLERAVDTPHSAGLIGRFVELAR
jgi:GMP synthase (glutamine-hydrolysing)